MEHTLPKRELRKIRLAYGLGDFYGGSAMGIIGLLLLFFLTNVANLSPLHAGVVVFIGRVIDASIDPFLGALTDRTRSRFGRRVPYFLWGIIPVMISFVLLWYVPDISSTLLRVAYYTFTYSFFSVSFSMVMVPYAALAPELTSDAAQRGSIVGTRMAFSIIGGLVAAVLPSLVISWYKQEVQTGYIVMSLIFAAVFGAIWALMFFVMRGREVCPTVESQPKMTASLKQVWLNKPFRVLVAIYLLAFIPNDITSANFKYFLNYFLGREGDFSLIIGLTMVSAVLSLPLYLALSRRIGKPQTMVLGSLFRSVSLVSYFFVNAESPLVLILFLAVLNGVGMGASYAVPWAMLPEVTDYDEAMTGARNEGIYAGIMTFIRSISSSIAILIIGAILEWSNYRGDALVQPDSALVAIRLTTILLPLALSLLAAFSASRFRIGPKNIASIQRLVELRRSGEFDRLSAEAQEEKCGEVRL